MFLIISFFLLLSIPSLILYLKTGAPPLVYGSEMTKTVCPNIGLSWMSGQMLKNASSSFLLAFCTLAHS